MITDTIIELSMKLKNIHEPWAITGGSNLVLRKLKKNTNDIDIITTRNGVWSIINIINNYQPKQKTIKSISSDLKLRSYYFNFEINGISIEVMGDPESKINNKWIDLDFWCRNIEVITYKSYNIPTTSLKYEFHIKKLINSKL